MVTEIHITVRSTDMDADRNVNNAVYFTYFEQSRRRCRPHRGCPHGRGATPQDQQAEGSR